MSSTYTKKSTWADASGAWLAVPSSSRHERRISVGILLLTMLLFFLFELHNAAGVTYSHWGPLGKSAGDDYDEGAYVASAQLVLKGFGLFGTVFSAQPALFLPTLALAVRLISDPIAAGHLYEAFFGSVVLLAVFWIGWMAYRPLGGALTVAILAVSPGFLLYAHAVESEMPMLAFCMLSIGAATRYYRRPDRRMALLTGLCLALGTEMKLLSVVAVLPVVLLLASLDYSRRANAAARRFQRG